MRYAILSDIHGNLEALQSVIQDIEKKSVDPIICLGDIVGYGPNPNECIQMIKATAKINLAGNHDYAPMGKIDTSYFNHYAKLAIEWTRTELKAESEAFLANLPLSATFNGNLFVHATPYRPDEWNYIFSIDDAIKNFMAFEEQICFIGHSHSPVIFVESNNHHYRVSLETQMTILDNERYIINIGSVGQPRDLNPRSAYAIYDTDTQTYRLNRVEYDIYKTQKKMKEAGLPDFLIARLQVGQ